MSDAAPQEVVDTRNIYQRLAAVMKAVRTVEKTRTNPHHKYKYTGHEDVTEVLRDKLLDHGVLREVSHTSTREGTIVRVAATIKYRNIDKPDEYLALETSGESTGTKEKPDDQQVGKALSYAVKMAELKQFMLLGDTTPDNEQSHGAEERGYQQPVQTPSNADLMQVTNLYYAVKSLADLDNARRAANRIAPGLTEDQYRQLSKMDSAAEAKVRG